MASWDITNQWRFLAWNIIERPTAVVWLQSVMDRKVATKKPGNAENTCCFYRAWWRSSILYVKRLDFAWFRISRLDWEGSGWSYRRPTWRNKWPIAHQPNWDLCHNRLASNGYPLACWDGRRTVVLYITLSHKGSLYTKGKQIDTFIPILDTWGYIFWGQCGKNNVASNLFTTLTLVD